MHARHGGVHLPPYAINVFTPLTPLTFTNGGTEFAPASHMWGERWEDEPCYKEETCPTHVFADLPEGSVRARALCCWVLVLVVLVVLLLLCVLVLLLLRYTFGTHILC